MKGDLAFGKELGHDKTNKTAN